MCLPTRKVRILLYRGHGLISWAIRWQTRSQYSHAAFLLDSTVYESVYPTGVRSRRVEPTDAFMSDCYYAWVSEDQYAGLGEWCKARIGCKYDKTAILRFIDRHHNHVNRKYFCSEYVVEGLLHIGVQLLRAPAWKISPGLLGMSMVLTKET